MQVVSTMQEKTDALLQKVAEGTRQVFQSDNYKNYLNTMSKFHSYSARNNLLIFMQCPHASYVAGFKAWKTNFNRYVKKGEHGISIIGFSKKKITKLQPKLNEHGQQMTDAAGKTIMEKVTVEIPNFVPVNVFDVSQTDGEPLPKLTMELSNTVDNYDTLFSALSQVSPFPIHIEHIEGGSKGYSNPIEHKIGIKSGMSNTPDEQKKAVDCGYWNLYRYNPSLNGEKNPFTLDSKEPKADFKDFLMGEVRYAALAKVFPELAEELFDKTEKDAKERLENYKKLAQD